MQIRFTLDLESNRVRQNLLQGMDRWVQLGLLSESQVAEIAATLSERLPAAAVATARQTEQETPLIDDFIASGRLATPADTQPSAIAESDEPAPVKANGLSRAIQSLLSEISVIWLLFLGVFLVVVSSGVLAASQWQSFSAVGQYAILFAYTLTFWGASLWTSRKPQLQTTAKMLSLATALLIPINFWMIDALSVFGSIAGIGFGILAAVILSLIASRLLETRLNKLNLIGLSWLHLGWMVSSISFWPVTATYLGTISSAANLFSQNRSATTDANSAAISETLSDENSASSSERFSFDTLTVAIAITILLFRSLFIAQVPPHQLGLAAGICGGLIAWLARSKPTRSFWDIAGFGLLFLGWAVSYGQIPPWQAIGTSAIALWILWDRLQQTWKSQYLFAFIGVACQTYSLLWFAIPYGTRASLLTALSQIPRSSSDSFTWASLGLFPLVIGILLLAKRLRHWQQDNLAKQTEFIALSLGAGLTLLSFPGSFTAAANLTLSTLTLIAVGRKRQSLEIATLTHAVGLMAIASSIDYFAPGLSVQRWTYIAIGSGSAELLAHLFIRGDRWRKNLWFGGIGLVAIAYGLLTSRYDYQPNWLWLPVPILFTIVANHRRASYPKTAAALSAVAFILQTPWIFLGWTAAIVNFAIATFCTGLNSRIWRKLYLPLFAVGSAISLVATIILYAYLKTPDPADSILPIFWVLGIWALWFIPRLLSRRENDLSARYQTACWAWGFVLFGVSILVFTTIAGAGLQALISNNIPFKESSRPFIPAICLLVAVLVEAIRHRPAEWRYWSLAWAVETAVVIGLVFAERSVSAIAVATLILSAIVIIAGDIWVKKHPGYRFSWHGIPIAYAAIGGGLARIDFTATTGLYTIAIALLLTGVGRRERQLNPASYLGLLLFTTGAYELLIYQLSQASGGSPGDGITILAALALVIALLEKWLSPWLQRYLKLPIAAIQNTAHLHWAFGSFLSAIALFAGLSQPIGTRLWTLISLLLAAYALIVGNRRWTPQTRISNHTVWTSIGLLEILLCFAFSRFELFFDRATLLTWAGLIACIASALIYRLPWDRWGWPLRPFRLLSIWLPMLTVATTVVQVKIPGLLAVSAFYAWMAKVSNRIRISYLSIFLLGWAILKFLHSQSLLTSLSIAIVTGLSLLYVAQVDPYFKDIQQRQQRHILRILASVAIALTALYQAEISNPMLLYAGLTLILCLGFIFSGLILKVRAFLYVGTLAFVVQIVRVLWLFISTYSLLLWGIGIVIGILLIWIAATFESRRSQVTQLLNTWTATLDTWD